MTRRRRLHERLSGAGGSHERVGRDVESEPEAIARGVGEAPLEIARVGEGDRVDEKIELPAEGLADLAEDACDLVVRADVALGHERAPD